MPSLLSRFSKSTAVKWLWTYRRWTWPLVVIFVLIAAGVIIPVARIIFSGGGAWFKFYLLVVLLGIGIYRLLHKKLPPVPVTALLIGIPLFLWGFWVIKPDWYMEWRNSKCFLWMIASLIALAWLTTNKKDTIAGLARTAILALLLAAVAVGACSKAYAGIQKVRISIPSGKHAERIFAVDTALKTVRLTKGDSVIAVTPPSYQLLGWTDEKMVSTYLYQRGVDQIRVFTLKPEADTSTIKWTIKPCDYAPHPCRW